MILYTGRFIVFFMGNMPQNIVFFYLNYGKKYVLHVLFWLFYVKSSPFSIEKQWFFIEKSVYLGSKLCFSADVLEFFIFGFLIKIGFLHQIHSFSIENLVDFCRCFTWWKG